MTGASKAFRLVNPHSTMKIDVKGKDGKTVEWTFVGGSVQAISRLGLKEGPNELKPVDSPWCLVPGPWSVRGPWSLVREEERNAISSNC